MPHTARAAVKRATYSYDAIDRHLVMIDPDSGRFTNTYDAKNELARIVNPQGQRTSFTFDAGGRQVRQQLGNGCLSTNVYDGANQLTGLINTSAGGYPFNRFTYAYDPTGQKTRAAEVNGTVTTWAYDKTRQLLHENRTGSNSFNVTHTYDPAGNRLTETDSGARTTYSYDQANQLLTENAPGGRTTYTHDNCGNRTQKNAPNGLTFYSWDETNRLVQADPPAGAVTFTYNAADRRIRKSTPSETQNFLYDFEKVLQEYDGDHLTMVEYTSTTQQYGNLISAFDHGQSLYFQCDGLGSTDALLNQYQFPTDRYSYRAFGLETHTGTGGALAASLANPLVMSLGTAGGPSAGTDFTFVGQQGYRYDLETEFYFVRKRYYDPVSCRWVSEDPIGYQGGDANLYRYVANSPVNSTDPTGLILRVPVSSDYGLFEKLLNELCAEGKWKLSKSGGEVTSDVAKFCEGYICVERQEIYLPNFGRMDWWKGELEYWKVPHTFSCDCICKAIRAKFQIKLYSKDGEGSESVPLSPDGKTYGEYNRKVIIGAEHPGGYPGRRDPMPPEGDAGRVRATRLIQFGHELCGHAVPGMHHPDFPREYTVADPVIQIENRIRAEHNLGQRMGQNDPFIAYMDLITAAEAPARQIVLFGRSYYYPASPFIYVGGPSKETPGFTRCYSPAIPNPDGLGGTVWIEYSMNPQTGEKCCQTTASSRLGAVYPGTVKK